MHVLIDGGSPGSRGYMRVLRGLLSPGMVPPDTQISLLCSPEFPAILGPLQEGVEVIEEPVLTAASRRKRINWWLKSYPELVRRRAPDVILHPVGFKRGDSGGVPSVVRATSMLPFDLREIRRYGISRQTLFLLRQRRRLMRSFQRADGVIFLSEHSRREILRQVPGVKKSAVVPNGLESYFKTEAPSRRPLRSPVKVLYVSTINPYKHQWNVVEAVALLRGELGMNIELSLVGGGEAVAQRKLARRIEELGASSFMTVTGDVPLDEMPSVYQDADVFVFATSCEGFPNTLIEAMGSGLPIACSDRMSMPDTLKDGGVFFDPEAPHSIVSALRTLLTDPELRFACATRAYEYVQEYTWEKAATQTYAFLRSVSRERSHG